MLTGTGMFTPAGREWSDGSGMSCARIPTTRPARSMRRWRLALTGVPLGIAFVVGRRPPTRRYTYGYGRAEDLAGIVIVLVIAASSALAAYEAITRLAHPRTVTNLIAVAVAAVIGFTGNELVARYRIRTGRKIGSAAPGAARPHARPGGVTPPAAPPRAGRGADGAGLGRPALGPLRPAGALAAVRP